MAIEPKRGCGYRKAGGLYMMGGGGGVPCGLLPLMLHICPACGSGIKQTRGWTWINPAKLFAGQKCKEASMLRARGAACAACPMGKIGELETAGLLWIGKQFYPTPEHFMLEADTMGICRRISSVPRGFKIGEHWVFLAHPEATTGKVDGEQHKLPGVFRIFKPTRIEKIVTETMAKDTEEMEKLTKRGITPFVVPDDDPDHQGTVYDKESEE